MSDRNVGDFFDGLTEDYTATIERCFPRYREMLWALLDYLPQQRHFRSVLELGCGTGNLSVLIQQAAPGAHLQLVDVSGESLASCQSRLTPGTTFTLDQRDFRQLDFEAGSFDLILSSISVHHLNASEKQTLFQRCHHWLTEDGIFSFADQCSGVSDDLSDRHLQNWRELTFQAGSSEEEWQMWMQHQAEHDHHDTLGDQMEWLRSAGFALVDCPWRYLLWSVIQARKA